MRSSLRFNKTVRGCGSQAGGMLSSISAIDKEGVSDSWGMLFVDEDDDKDDDDMDDDEEDEDDAKGYIKDVR